MAKFMLIYRHNTGSSTNISPEEMPKIHQKWQTWVGEGLQKGWMLDPGHGLKPEEGLVVSSKKVVTDGPFAETKEQLGGYHLIECKDRDEAVSVASRIPPLAAGGVVEVRPVLWAE